MFKVLNPHLNIQKHPRHLRNRESSQTPCTKKKIPDIVHINEDTSEAIPSTYSTPFNPISAEFLPFIRIHTRDQRVNFSQSIIQPIIQTMVQPEIQTDYPDNMVTTNKPDPYSPLFTLASVSVEFLKYVTRGSVPTPA